MTVERPLRLNFEISDERIERFKQGSYFTGLIVSKKRKAGESKEKELEAGREKQRRILAVLEGLKIVNCETHETHEKGIYQNRLKFEKYLKKSFNGSEVHYDTELGKALLAPGALGERDPLAEICCKGGKPEPDPELRNTESVKLPVDIDLPLPLDYESSKNKGKVSNEKLLKLVKVYCEEYLKAEVLPYRSDAWIDHSKTKVGYEIPFTRHFYKYQPPRPLQEIEADIKALEKDIVRMLAKVTS